MKRNKKLTSYIMSRIKSSGSVIEKTMAIYLRENQIKYRKNIKSIFGKPDFVLKGQNIVIFCDSEFWHGYDWKNRKKDFKTNKKYWFSKIERNIKRDQLVSRQLRKQGWTVLRFWEKDITNNPTKCLRKIQRYLK